jgi:hypothetical protein
MAGLKISDSRSFKLEPVRKNRFLFQFSSVPGNKDGLVEGLAFVAKSASVPVISFEKTQTKRIHEAFNTAGMVSWNDLNVVFNDFIRNTSAGQSGEVSAGDAMYNWCSMIYNPLTGQMGYKTQYATSATEANFDPAGNIIRAWNIFGIFPTSVDFGGTLSYEDAGATEIACTYAYDLAIKVEDSQSSTESA